MGYATRAAVAVIALGGLAACGGGDEEAAVPATQDTAPADTVVPGGGAMAPAPAADTAVMTGQFRPGDGASPGQEVTGVARVFPAPIPSSPGPRSAELAADGFRLDVEVIGLAVGEHAWHIHSGTCADGGPVVAAITPTSDSPGFGEPLVVGSLSSSARASVSVPPDQLTLQQLEDAPYSIHVHAGSGVDHGPTVACANLVRTSEPSS